ncbi:MAG: hypothetical protein JSW47_04605 [Phycisphaerales bacterium]|nr:MAG: hypothetical protein JSW47_04605 [Phycisphaerales bacterium]
MIRFACSSCSRLISVDEKHSGKKGKCPKCGGVVVVPESSTVIEFACGSCGHKIRVPAKYAGKKGKCPKCKNPVLVPSLEKPPAEAAETLIIACSMCEQEIKVTEDSRGQVVECPACGSYVEVPSEEIPMEETATPAQTREDDEAVDKRRKEPKRPKGEVEVEKSAPPGERMLPWPIDILLYPTSSSGLAAVAGVAAAPVVFIFLLRFGPPCCLLGLVYVVGFIFALLYVYWYFCECIRDSAFGGVRAPRGPGESMDWGDLLWSGLRLLACYLFFFGPLILYRFHVGRSRAEVNYVVFLSLLAYADFFYPMGILGVVMFESVRGLNPIFILRSVAVTFLPYCGLVALFYGLGVFFEIGIAGSLLAARHVAGDSLLSLILYIVIKLVGFAWLLLVTGHLLGRFYWRYQEKLYWKA